MHANISLSLSQMGRLRHVHGDEHEYARVQLLPKTALKLFEKQILLKQTHQPSGYASYKLRALSVAHK
ncbi:hypothetical protein D3C72_1415810 [compost metagenome]